MGETWKNINRILGKSKVWTCLSHVINNHISTDPLAITNHFNNHFANVAYKLTENLPTNVTQYKDYLLALFLICMCLNPTNSLKVKKLIVELESKSSRSIDEILSILNKSTPDNVIYALKHIFNKSFAEGKFITAFTKAKVIPVFKKRCRSDVANHRPISLLPVMSKILEKLMYDEWFLF